MTNPPSDVATFLEGAGLGLTFGTDLFTGPVRDVSTGVPKDAIFVKGLPGGLPERTMGEIDEIRSPIVSIQVRNTTFSAGDTQARAIQEALQSGELVGYIDVVPQQSEPFVLPQDNEGLHQWSMIYTLKYVDAA